MYSKTLILFDIGGVLVKLNYGNFYEQAAKYSSHSAKEIEKKYIQSRLDFRVCRGEITALEFMNELRDCLEIPKKVTQEELERIVGATFPDQISEMIALKEQLHQIGYTVGILSNIGEHVHKILLKRYPEIFAVYNPMCPSLLSYQVKVMKPEPRIYDAVVGFENIIFIDDKDAYLKVGIQRGWKGIHYVEYPDTTEPQRKSHSDTGYQHPWLKSAKSIREVKNSLREFGVKV